MSRPRSPSSDPLRTCSLTPELAFYLGATLPNLVWRRNQPACCQQRGTQVWMSGEPVMTSLCNLGRTLLSGLAPGSVPGCQGFSKAGSVLQASRSQNYVTHLEITLTSFSHCFISRHTPRIHTAVEQNSVGKGGHVKLLLVFQGVSFWGIFSDINIYQDGIR